MRKNIELSEAEYGEILNQFYGYFGDGYKFEEFLKIYLEKMGLEEVFVTRKSGDGGIDLTAVRKGVGGLSNAVDEPFYIQAKRYPPTDTVAPEKIRALRGSFGSGTGMLITTGKVSDRAKTEAREIDPARPIIVVDGKELVSTCIDKEIGFTFKPLFSKVALDGLMGRENSEGQEALYTVERIVTESDIMSYVLILPRPIKDLLPRDAREVTISFDGAVYKEYRIDASRRYVGGIAKVYRQFGLKQPDGVFVSKKAVWHIQPEGRFFVEFQEIE